VFGGGEVVVFINTSNKTVLGMARASHWLGVEAGLCAKVHCNVICIEKKQLMIKLTLMIKWQITLTSIEIFLNTSTPFDFLNTLISSILSNFISIANTQFNFSHFSFIYLISVFSFKN
jgi:hypothetical protein